MSINDDEFMMHSSWYHDKLEILVNTLTSELKSELRHILLSELGKSHSHIALLIERLARKVSESEENKENFLHLDCFDGDGCNSKGSGSDDQRQSLIDELNSVRSENLILKQWISELEDKSGNLLTVSKQDSGFEFSIRSQLSHPEQELGLDFSIPDDRR